MHSSATTRENGCGSSSSRKLRRWKLSVSRTACAALVLLGASGLLVSVIPAEMTRGLESVNGRDVMVALLVMGLCGSFLASRVAVGSKCLHAAARCLRSPLGKGPRRDAGVLSDAAAPAAASGPALGLHTAAAAESGAREIPSAEIVLLDAIGRGGMGQVFAARWRSAPVAVKLVTAPMGRSHAEEALQREARILASLRHPCICSFLGVARVRGGLALVLELMESSLFRFLHQGGHRNEPRRLESTLLCRLARESAQGLAYLHRCHYLHQDVKASNVLLDASLHAKVCDFGLADVVVRAGASEGALGPEPATSECVGTLRYMAPELTVTPGTAYSERCDVYSFGLLLWEIFHQEVAFGNAPGITVAACLAAHGKRPALRLPSDCVASVGPLITSCWEHDATARPTMAACVERLAPSGYLGSLRRSDERRPTREAGRDS